MKKIKVLEVIYGLGFGGIRACVQNYVTYINKDEFHIDVYAFGVSESPFEAQFEKLGCYVHMDPANDIADGHIFRFVKKLYDFIKQGQYDVVHAHCNLISAWVTLAAMMAGAKIRISHSHTTAHFLGNWKQRAWSYLRRWIISRTATIQLACGKLAGESMYGPKGHFIVLPNGINVERFRHKWIALSTVAVAVLVIWSQQDAVFGYLNDTLSDLGFNTRVFDMMAEGGLSDANGRDVLFSFFKGKIETGGLFGYGILGDRALMNMENGYPHNLALELWVDFGLFLGTALLIILLYLFVRAFISTSNQDIRAYLMLFFTVGVFSLFLSDSYISNPMFFMAIGYAVRTIRDSRTNNYHTSQLHHANENPIP